MSRRVRKMSGVSIKGILLFVCIILIFGASGVAFYMFKNARDDAEEAYRKRIDELERRINSCTGTAYRAGVYIPAGSVLEPNMLEKFEILTDSGSFATDSDIGKKVLVDVKPGSEITKNILNNEEKSIYQKETELNFVYIPENVEADNYVDIRLRFPDGTDYIVISKKKVIKLDTLRKRLYVNLSEEEILLIDSALFDTYNYPGSEIYLTKYLFPEKEEASFVNYSPSIPLYELIMNNPNIQNIMSASLSAKERIELENSLYSFVNTETGYANTGERENGSDAEHGGTIWD